MLIPPKGLLAHVVVATLFATSMSFAASPKVVVISLDGAKPDLIEKYLKNGVLPKDGALGRLAKRGVVAEQNVTATPSVTAVSHIAIATGSTAAHNDITGNTFHPVVASVSTTISGFAAPIGGYQRDPLGEAFSPTAEPLWVQLRNHGKKVVTATWPGSDGADIRISNVLVQDSEPTRSTDYTVPFGAFGGVGAAGFEKTGADFQLADATLVSQLMAAGFKSYSPPRVTTSPFETIYCAPASSSTCGTTNASGRTLQYLLKAAALDTSDDGVVNYDSLVFFDSGVPIQPGPYALPSTGPARVRIGGQSAKFFFEGSFFKVGAAFFVSRLDPDLSTVRFVRYGTNYIPPNAAVTFEVNDINTNVGFWAPQPDFRIPERLSPGFGSFPDLELEAIYEDQVATWMVYQTNVALRALGQVPDADLAMIYLEQPDGSGHQFTLTDPRQATNPTDAHTIGSPGNPAGATGQDAAKIARYATYLANAYRAADAAVARILEAVGTDKHGEPLADVFVVSDHGMAPFHTAIDLKKLIDTTANFAAGEVCAAFPCAQNARIRLTTTGPATNIYVNLIGRESSAGPATVSPNDYQALVERVAAALRGVNDPNVFYNPNRASLFSDVWTRPEACGKPGLCVGGNFGQDTGDILALMVEGYNFDGTQSPAVIRLGDALAAAPSYYSVPNFYGAHGHRSELASMSAIFYAAGPNIKQGKKIRSVRNIDVAPTVLELLGVAPAPTVDGAVIPKILRKQKD